MEGGSRQVKSRPYIIESVHAHAVARLQSHGFPASDELSDNNTRFIGGYGSLRLFRIDVNLGVLVVFTVSEDPGN